VWRTTRERADATIRRLVGQGFTEGTDEDCRIVLSKPDDTALEGGRRWLRGLTSRGRRAAQREDAPATRLPVHWRNRLFAVLFAAAAIGQVGDPVNQRQKP
jgi:hypothetical protein